jgi:integrase
VGRKLDPNTGRLKRKQKWFTFKGTKQAAEKKLTELLRKLDTGQVIEPSKLTLGQWLDEWLGMAIKPPHRRQRTYETYSSVVTKHLKPKLGSIRLADLRSSHLQQYYDHSTLKKATLQVHHAIVYSALKAATKQDLVPRNVAGLVIGKPRGTHDRKEVMEHCWDEQEAKTFLDVAKDAGTQAAAFYSLALDSGARKAELCGLKWGDLDIQTGMLSIVRQLVKPGPEPVFGPPKNGQPRTILLTPGTIALLRKHKVEQAKGRLELGTAYKDHGLIFAKVFGQPLQMNNLGQREYQTIVKLAGVKRIKFHGLRHTCATLLFNQGKPVKVVAERLGHKDTSITLDVYAHVQPSMQEAAAAALETVLHGRALEIG